MGAPLPLRQGDGPASPDLSQFEVVEGTIGHRSPSSLAPASLLPPVGGTPLRLALALLVLGQRPCDRLVDPHGLSIELRGSLRADLVSPGPLGGIQGEIRPLEQGLQVLSVDRPDGDPSRDRDATAGLLLPMCECGGSDRGAEAVGRSVRLVAVYVRNDDEELLAAIATDELLLARLFPQQLAQRPQELIAGQVTIRVVVVLEVV